MRKRGLTLALLALLGVAQARFYLGFPGSGIVGSSGGAAVGGLHVGTYNLYNDFGVRATAEAGAIFGEPNSLIVEGGVDGTYSFGEGVVFYTGAGVGYMAVGDSGSPFVGAFVGLDFDAASVISIFLEINPRYAFSSTGFVQIRSGINFHIGSPLVNPMSVPDAGLPWLGEETAGG